MTARNDVTGDAIKSKTTSKEYASNWDRIFGKKKDSNETETKTKQEDK